MSANHTCRISIPWARNELVPFLQNAFGSLLGYRNGSADDWMALIHSAEDRIEELASKCWEDFDSTVERVRLMVLTPGIFNGAERNDYEWVRDDPKLVIGIMVRHAIDHGSAHLRIHSLGTASNPDIPRNTSLAPTAIQWERFAGKRPQRGGVQGGQKRPHSGNDGPKPYRDDHRGGGGHGHGGGKYGGGHAHGGSGRSGHQGGYASSGYGSTGGGYRPGSNQPYQYGMAPPQQPYQQYYTFTTAPVGFGTDCANDVSPTNSSGNSSDGTRLRGDAPEFVPAEKRRKLG